jgi:antitoxin HicB
MSDGDTIEEALGNAFEAESAWLAAKETWGAAKKLPPAKLVARLPRSLHSDLQRLAGREGVSINTMLVSLLVHGIAESVRSAH